MQKNSLKLRIAHLYPDLLNIYGDMGNIVALEKRLRWRGIEVETTKITSGMTIKADDYDLFFAGGGQDNQQMLRAQVNPCLLYVDLISFLGNIILL